MLQVGHRCLTGQGTAAIHVDVEDQAALLDSLGLMTDGSDGLPIGIHPLISVVARPVKHVRLVTALLKAATLMQNKARHVPLHGAGKSHRCAPHQYPVVSWFCENLGNSQAAAFAAAAAAAAAAGYSEI